MRNLITCIIVGTFCLPGCSAISTALTPASVVDNVARGYTVAKQSVETPPVNPDDINAYLEINRDLWKQLAIWYELIEEEE